MFSKQFLSTLCLVGAALIWGTAFVAQTTGMEYVGPLTFTNIRFIIGGLLVLPFAFKEISNNQFYGWVVGLYLVTFPVALGFLDVRSMSPT